jgi:hypothetical protein
MSPSYVCIHAGHFFALSLKQKIEAEQVYSLHGILDQLRPNDWREIKARADVHTFQCDILGNLPLEIVALVAECLPLIDIIRLRRVR